MAANAPSFKKFPRLGALKAWHAILPEAIPDLTGTYMSNHP